MGNLQFLKCVLYCERYPQILIFNQKLFFRLKLYKTAKLFNIKKGKENCSANDFADHNVFNLNGWMPIVSLRSYLTKKDGFLYVEFKKLIHFANTKLSWVTHFKFGKQEQNSEKLCF